MPNGGVPRLLVVRPNGAPLVIVSDRASLRLVDATEFESRGVAAAPIVELSDPQAAELARHLAYWVEHTPPPDERPEPGTVLRDY